MLRGVNPNLYELAEQQFLAAAAAAAASLNLAQAQYNDALDEAIYGSDEFRMYAFKIKKCTRMRSHDWTECPYAHRGEKAQRRDPRKVPYTAIACPAFRNGRCVKGGACEFAHGVFEYWLHPARYRTRPCNAGRFCQRKVCFFAHTPDQLRSESKYKCHFTYKGRMMDAAAGDNNNNNYHHHHHHDHDDHRRQLMMMMGGEGATSSMQGGHAAAAAAAVQSLPPTFSPNPTNCTTATPMAAAMKREMGSSSSSGSSLGGVSDYLKNSLMAFREEEEREMMMKQQATMNNNGGYGHGDVGSLVSDSDLPNELDWISELVK